MNVRVSGCSLRSTFSLNCRTSDPAHSNSGSGGLNDAKHVTLDMMLRSGIKSDCADWRRTRGASAAHVLAVIVLCASKRAIHHRLRRRGFDAGYSENMVLPASMFTQNTESGAEKLSMPDNLQIIY